MKVYLDNNATTKMDSEVLEAMIPYLTEFYGIHQAYIFLVEKQTRH